MNISPIGLVPNWVFISKQGALKKADKYIKKDASIYGYDAFRVFYRIAVDAKWNNSDIAKSYLAVTNIFFKSEWQKKHSFSSLYDIDGTRISKNSSLSTDVGPTSIFIITDDALGDSIFSELFTKTYNKNGYWGNGKEYYDQNWAWFETALYSNNFVKPSI